MNEQHPIAPCAETTTNATAAVTPDQTAALDVLEPPPPSTSPVPGDGAPVSAIDARVAPVRDATGSELSTILGVAETLSETEQAELDACETVIQTGWQKFVEVGLALARIRKDRLYRTTFDTFEDYCRVRWQYGRNYVNRLISAAQVFTHLVTISLMPFGNSFTC